MESNLLTFDITKELERCKTIEDLMGRNGVVKRMVKEMTEKLLEAEMKGHLGYEKHEPSGRNSGNSRNGTSEKTVRSDFGSIPLDIPRDRNGDFVPQLVKKGQTDISSFDEKIISMYGKGMTTRDIQSHITDLYGIEISPTTISNITDKVMSAASDWQSRPLASLYPIVYFDAIHYKIKDNGKVLSKAAYTALGIDVFGKKDILGIWIGEAEGAHFWLSVVNELKNRGVDDILIACVDGLKGFPEAITTVYPKVEIQLCIIHMIRNSLKFIGSKNQKAFMEQLKTVYKAPSEKAALDALDELELTWGDRYPIVIKSWRANWENLATFFKYPEAIRRIIYTTNAVEGLHRQFRKVTKNRSVFPNDDALQKMLYLASGDIMKKWTMSVPNWSLAISQLSIRFEGRLKLEL